jgi:hypothetical protein
VRRVSGEVSGPVRRFRLGETLPPPASAAMASSLALRSCALAARPRLTGATRLLGGRASVIVAQYSALPLLASARHFVACFCLAETNAVSTFGPMVSFSSGTFIEPGPPDPTIT